MWVPSREVARRSLKKRSNYYIDIDVSAFAGVMMALLFSFMVNVSYIVPRGSTDLPKAHYIEFEPGASREDAINVAVTRDGAVFIGSIKTSPEDLPTLIRSATKKGAERKVYLSADARVRYQDVETVAEQIRVAGITSIAIMTNGSMGPSR